MKPLLNKEEALNLIQTKMDAVKRTDADSEFANGMIFALGLLIGEITHNYN